MNTPCPQCGWVHPPKERKKYPPAHYRNNTTPIEVHFAGGWETFGSVAEAARVTGIKAGKLFRALRGGPNQRIEVRLAKVGAQ